MTSIDSASSFPDAQVFDDLRSALACAKRLAFRYLGRAMVRVARIEDGRYQVVVAQ
jgi:hypothetical protein